MRIAVCGVWHVHTEEYTRVALKHGEVIGVWDENPQWAKEFADKLGIPVLDSFQQLLESDAEGVIVCSATNRHTELMIQLADAGKHIFTEKVMTLSDEDADRIAEAVERNGVQFVISLPHRFMGSTRAVKKIVDSGELGKVNYLRYRNCHSGSSENWLPDHFYNAEQCGGGAMIDLGAHGMYITDWILGAPDTYTSTFTLACTNPDTALKNTDRVEDNAITMMGYANGCIALNETGFVTTGCPRTLEVGGELGFVRLEGNAVFKSTKATNFERVEVEPEADLPLPCEQFVTGNVLGDCGMEDAKRLTHMMVCAYKNRV